MQYQFPNHPDMVEIGQKGTSGGVNFCNQYENVLITPLFFVINWLFFCSQYVKYRNQYEEKGNQYEKRGNQYEKRVINTKKGVINTTENRNQRFVAS